MENLLIANLGQIGLEIHNLDLGQILDQRLCCSISIFIESDILTVLTVVAENIEQKFAKIEFKSHNIVYPGISQQASILNLQSACCVCILFSESEPQTKDAIKS